MEKLECLNKETILLLKKHNSLNNLIKSILVEEAINSVNLSQAELDNIIEQVKAANGIEKEVTLEEWLEEKKVTKENFFKEIIRPHQYNKFCIDKFQNKTEARFLAVKDSLDIVVYSLIRVKDLHLAKELFQRIIEGESEFADISAKYSEGPEKLTRGIVGPVALDKAMEPLKEVLKSSKPGELRQPIYLKKWYLLVRLESINHAKLDKNMISQLSKDLFNEWINSKVQIQIEKLVDRSSINENIIT